MYDEYKYQKTKIPRLMQTLHYSLTATTNMIKWLSLSTKNQLMAAEIPEEKEQGKVHLAINKRVWHKNWEFLSIQQ